MKTNSWALIQLARKTLRKTYLVSHFPVESDKYSFENGEIEWVVVKVMITRWNKLRLSVSLAVPQLPRLHDMQNKKGNLVIAGV